MLIARSYPPVQQLSEEEREEQRNRASDAAEARQRTFKQGGGGEKLKAKAAKREAAERDARLTGPNQLTWTAS